MGFAVFIATVLSFTTSQFYVYIIQKNEIVWWRRARRFTNLMFSELFKMASFEEITDKHHHLVTNITFWIPVILFLFKVERSRQNFWYFDGFFFSFLFGIFFFFWHCFTSVLDFVYDIDSVSLFNIVKKIRTVNYQYVKNRKSRLPTAIQSTSPTLPLPTPSPSTMKKSSTVVKNNTHLLKWLKSSIWQTWSNSIT